MRPTALTTITLTYICGLLGIVATLRALLVAWYTFGYGFGTAPLRFCHSILNLVLLAAVTIAFFAGAVLLGRGERRGRTLVIAASSVVIVLTLIELAVWIGPGFAAWTNQGVLGVTRWVWLALSIVTLVLALLAGNETPSTAEDPDVVEPQGRPVLNLLVAALAVAMAAYQLWLAKKQFDYSLLYITDLTDLLPTTPSATWTLAMFEPLSASVVAAAVLFIGGVLMAVGFPAARLVVIAGCILTVAQGIFGWTDLDRLFHEIGASELVTIFAPRTSSVVVLTLTVPVVTAVLAAVAPVRTART
ncbi:hypothetical protein H5U98_05980 [Mycolicibacterium boenickei]|uniref:Integral membrane protein n=1 Tax=Mycolicibacterium boenickei TaxID=146017 RepID=A0AAX3A0F5_9MYCO|nr:hypothetical protein [Mycolicibacterium boenickei]UNC00957.1 hypothetical protein H5U98_05980 [Mycolicibacterium boenickei]BBX90774.1 hypothetical protein MBOE_24230 [Mycolicibacterium boenickei]